MSCQKLRKTYIFGSVIPRDHVAARAETRRTPIRLSAMCVPFSPDFSLSPSNTTIPSVVKPKIPSNRHDNRAENCGCLSFSFCLGALHRYCRVICHPMCSWDQRAISFNIIESRSVPCRHPNHSCRFAFAFIGSSEICNASNIAPLHFIHILRSVVHAPDLRTLVHLLFFFIFSVVALVVIRVIDWNHVVQLE